MKKLYRVKATIVRRSTAFYRVFAEGGAEAESLVKLGQGERVGRLIEDVIERASYDAKLDKGAEE